MPIDVKFCTATDGKPSGAVSLATIRSVAAQVRSQVSRETGVLALSLAALVTAGQRVVVNGRGLALAWDLTRPLRDEDGRPVLGMCEADPDEPDCAFVSVNAVLTARRPDLALSTAAHELGHVLFDVPKALDAGVVRYRAVATSVRALDRCGRDSEGRANEFMGSLLVPPAGLHTRLLALARSEGLCLARAPHQGRRGSPVLAAGAPPDTMAGIVAVLAQEFGVSERFIAVRLSRYGLVQGGV